MPKALTPTISPDLFLQCIYFGSSIHLHQWSYIYTFGISTVFFWVWGITRDLSRRSHSCFKANSVGVGLGLVVGNAVKIFHYRRQSLHWFKTSGPLQSVIACNTSLPSIRTTFAKNTNAVFKQTSTSIPVSGTAITCALKWRYHQQQLQLVTFLSYSPSWCFLQGWTWQNTCQALERKKG